MKKLSKKVVETLETVEAYACICSCDNCNCNCSYTVGATNRYYSSQRSKNSSRTSSRRS